MFTLDSTIDTIQGIKRAATNQFITDPTLNKTAHAYIDAQTEFAKMMASNAMTLAKYSVDTATSCFSPKKA